MTMLNLNIFLAEDSLDLVMIVAMGGKLARIFAHGCVAPASQLGQKNKKVFCGRLRVWEYGTMPIRDILVHSPNQKTPARRGGPNRD